jgi:hypothetical protein
MNRSSPLFLTRPAILHFAFKLILAVKFTNPLSSYLTLSDLFFRHMLCVMRYRELAADALPRR